MPYVPKKNPADRIQAYEAVYFARKHGLTALQARTILAKVGPSRIKATAEALKLKKT